MRGGGVLGENDCKEGKGGGVQICAVRAVQICYAGKISGSISGKGELSK